MFCIWVIIKSWKENFESELQHQVGIEVSIFDNNSKSETKLQIQIVTPNCKTSFTLNESSMLEMTFWIQKWQCQVGK